jgi:ribosomal protein S18 acetylase RimI-like enzyme
VKTSAPKCKHYFYITDEKDESIATVAIYRRHGVLWMTDVWTSPDHRRKGLASKLIRAALDQFGAESIYLHVAAHTDQPLDDQALIAWYQRFGFESAPFPGAMVRNSSKS